jgi:hypothetical protein
MLLWTLSGFRATAAEAGKNERVSFRWMVPEAHKKTVESELAYEGEIQKAEGKGAVVWVFVGLALVPSLVQAVIKLQRQIQYGGIVIDARKAPLDIRVNKRLPSGLIVVLQPDGKVQFERDEVEGPDKIIELIMRGRGGE